MANERALFKKSVSGFTDIFSLNLLSKALTFLLNVAIIRSVAPQAKGLSYFFTGLVTTTLFLQREALRLFVQRQKPLNDTPDPPKSFARLITYGWLALVWGILITVIASIWVTYQMSESKQYENISLFTPFLLYVVAVLLEMVAEPLYLVAQNLLMFRLRVIIEGMAIFISNLGLFMLLWTSETQGRGTTPAQLRSTSISFAVSQIIHSLVIVVGYFGYFLLKGKTIPELKSVFKRKRQLLPHAGSRGASMVEWNDFSKSFSLWTESVLRWVLTEGERLVLTSMALLSDQGAYEVVMNLGSLVARLVFKLVEESCLTTWGKLLGGAADRRQQPTREALELSSGLYILVLQFLLLLGAVFVVFGCPYSPTLLYILYGTTWLESSAPTLLQWYCVYVFFMGLSGTCESFIRATAGSADLRRLQLFQMICGVGYLVGMYFFNTWFGCKGIIIANTVSMMARFGYCAGFYARRYFAVHKYPLFRLSTVFTGIHPLTYLCALVCAGVNVLLVGWLPVGQSVNYVVHVGVGGVLFGLFLASVVLFNKPFIRNLRLLRKGEFVTLG